MASRLKARGLSFRAARFIHTRWTPAKQAILIATGDDRPGVLDDVSLYLHEHKADILESRVSLLRGQFALLLLVRAEETALQKIQQGLSTLDQAARIRT